jgi:DeoR/GlpR family transcriptional regulator of sugar metabolism
MAKPLFVEERRQAILDQLKRDGRVSVEALSEVMHVSAVTIRQDLRALEEAGLLQRTYGGAISRGAAPHLPELSFHIRQSRNRSEKDAIAAAAIRLVENGYSVALDASTTSYALIPYLRRFDKLTIVTNSLVTAQSFLEEPRIEVLMPAGRLRRDSISLVGRPDELPDINLNIGFFGARGITLRNGITDVDPDEVLMKQAMMARCLSVVVLVDATKWGQVAPYTVRPVSGIDHIITSNNASPDIVSQIQTAGVSVEFVPFVEAG